MTVRVLLQLMALLIFALPAYAAADSCIDPTPAKFRFSFEEVSLPDNEQIGLAGGLFLYDVNSWASVGPAAYGAITGDRGGFITLGLAAELKKNILERLQINTGLFVGAGGGRGGSTLQGGGLMLRAHLGAQFETDSWGNLGAGLSYIDFPNGSINSLQPYVAYEYPFTVLLNHGWPDSHFAQATGQPGLADSESEFSVIYRTYKIPSSVLNDNGAPQYSRINLLGVEWQRELENNLFLKIEAAGAMGGESNGYMQMLLGGGYRLSLTSVTALKASVSLGAAGGGGVATGGGVLMESSLALQQRLSQNLFVELGGGYVNALDGDFRAASLNAKLGYRYHMPEVQDGAVPFSTLAAYRPHNSRLRFVHQTYLKNDPHWRNQNADLDVNLLGFQCDWFLTKHFYLSGQGISAYQGKAGGYMLGLIGGGVHLSRAGLPFFIDLELLGGAAGGGGLDVGGGAVWQSHAGLGYQFTGPYSLIASYGQIAAPEGNFKAHVLGLALAYHFSLFAR